MDRSATHSMWYSTFVKYDQCKHSLPDTARHPEKLNIGLMERKECTRPNRISLALCSNDRTLQHQGTLAGYGRMQYREMNGGSDNR